MATRSGQKAAGEHNSRGPAQGRKDRTPTAGPVRPGTQTRTRAPDQPASGGPSPGRFPPEAQGTNGAPVVRHAGPRRVLIFARTFSDAQQIAQRKKYPRELWRFVTGIADVADLDPRDWATITVPGFGTGHENRLKWDAYQHFQQSCRGYGVKVPSYDP